MLGLILKIYLYYNVICTVIYSIVHLIIEPIHVDRRNNVFSFRVRFFFSLT